MRQTHPRFRSTLVLIMSSTTPARDIRSLLTRPFLSLLTYRLGVVLCYQITSVVVGWQIYQITGSELALGLIGLAEVIPYFTSALFAGYAVDHYSRRFLGGLACILLAVMSFTLWWVSSDFGVAWITQYGAWPIYAAIALSGFARAFLSPVYNTLLVRLFEREDYARATGIGSSVFQFAQIVGPAIGGGLLAVGHLTWAYGATLMCATAALIGLLGVPKHATDAPNAQSKQSVALIFSGIAQGLRFVFSHPILLAALALDMFAVLFGGAMALLPAFVKNVLHSGPETLGLLRAAPACGAILMGLYLARHPINRNAGRILLSAVAGFGVAMIVFALSKSLWLSVGALFTSGVFDSVSVVLRSTILQLTTPDEMRGRVSAINGIFIGSSNELGAFESGVAARFMGLVPSVVFGGVMTLLIVAVVARAVPRLRRLHIHELV